MLFKIWELLLESNNKFAFFATHKICLKSNAGPQQFNSKQAWERAGLPATLDEINPGHDLIF